MKRLGVAIVRWKELLKAEMSSYTASHALQDLLPGHGLKK